MAEGAVSRENRFCATVECCDSCVAKLNKYLERKIRAVITVDLKSKRGLRQGEKLQLNQSKPV